MDEAKLLEKLRLIEALYAGAATEGEQDAAGRARHRILARLEEWARDDPPVEYQLRTCSSTPAPPPPPWR
jgi:hypothetical protein